MKYSFQEHILKMTRRWEGEWQKQVPSSGPEQAVGGEGGTGKGREGLRSGLATEWKELDPPARFFREEP